MASASDHRAHAALQPADCLVLLPQRLPAAVETSIGPAHYPAECTQSDAFLQPSLRARYGRANSNSFMDVYPEGLETFADQVIPLLQKRGRFRRNYEEKTLRERFRFPRPARMLPAGARSVASLLQKQAG